MKKLILHPTEISQWHALINEAQSSAALILNEETESYLVYLLMRYCHKAKLIESVVALDFLKSIHSNRPQRIELLREVGDKSLLFCGLFPGLAEKRRVSLTYFIDMGQAAYLTVSELHEYPSAKLYYELSEKFVTLQQVLQAMRTDVVNGMTSIAMDADNRLQ